MSARRALSHSAKELVLLECGYMCANPRCRTMLTLDIHHLEHVRTGGSNKPENLLALCPNCHALHHRQNKGIPTSALRVWKGMLSALNVANRSNVDLLLMLHKMEGDTFLSTVQFSGDGLLTLAGLFNSQLVSIAGGVSSSRDGAMVRVRLTPRGLALVQAWVEGNEVEFLAAQRALAGDGA